MDKPSDRFGARIAYLPSGMLLVQQTKYSEDKRRHVLDHFSPGDKIERHVKMKDDIGIATAVRLAVEGKLTKS